LDVKTPLPGVLEVRGTDETLLAGALGELEPAGPVDRGTDVDDDVTMVSDNVDVETTTLVPVEGDALDTMIVLTTGETPVAGELVVGLTGEIDDNGGTWVLFRK
jgi:hypothetical protein